MLLQSQKPSLRPMTTAHLAQTMTLLELTTGELIQKIDNALASNPALELVDEPRCPHCHRLLPPRGPCPACSAPLHTTGDQPIVFVSPRYDFHQARGRAVEDDDFNRDEWVAAIEDLPTFVLRQIAPELTLEDRPIAAHLLTSLDEDGLLTVSLFEVARFHHVPLSRVELVQKQIQRAEPLGVGSATPQEALLVQLEVLAENHPVPELATRAIQCGMELLSRRAYGELGRCLGISARQAERIAVFISDNLNPFPGRSHWGDIHQGAGARPIYQEPDVVISRLHQSPNTPLVVEVVSPYAGSLRVSALFRQALAQAPREKSEAWQADMEEAVLLVKCLQQRDNTLVRLMQRLVTLQRRYILEGDAEMIPLTRAQLAEELEVHESTISRAVAGKAVQLPNKKIVPLAKWFDRSLNVRTALLQIIAKEQQPLSDTDIVGLLAEQGYAVARRTVAKYRSMEGILPARLRHNTALSIANE
jgi:RNA polymerase sigma-54 factor